MYCVLIRSRYTRAIYAFYSLSQNYYRCNEKYLFILNANWNVYYTLWTWTANTEQWTVNTHTTLAVIRTKQLSFACFCFFIQNSIYLYFILWMGIVSMLPLWSWTISKIVHTCIHICKWPLARVFDFRHKKSIRFIFVVTPITFKAILFHWS